MTHYFSMSYLLHFLFILYDLKLWVHQAKIYITSLSFNGKGCTKNNHKEHECAKFQCVNLAYGQTFTSLAFNTRIFFICYLFRVI